MLSEVTNQPKIHGALNTFFGDIAKVTLTSSGAIADGRMMVKIGGALIRPMEFLVLQFVQQMQTG